MPNVGQTIDTILHDIIAGGILAATIFVKNPNSQQKAALMIDAVNRLLPMLDSQLVPPAPAPTPLPGPTTPVTPAQ